MGVAKEDLFDGAVVRLIPGVNESMDNWLTEGREYAVMEVIYHDEVFYNIVDDTGDQVTIDGYRMAAVEPANVDPKELEELWG